MENQTLSDVVSYIRGKTGGEFLGRPRIGYITIGKEKYFVITPRKVSIKYHPLLTIAPIPSAIKIIGFYTGRGFVVNRIKGEGFKFCANNVCATLKTGATGIYIVRVLDLGKMTNYYIPSSYRMPYSGVLFDVESFRKSVNKGLVKVTGGSIEEKMKRVAFALSGLVAYGTVNPSSLKHLPPEKISSDGNLVFFPVLAESFGVDEWELDPLYFVNPLSLQTNPFSKKNRSELIKLLRKMSERESKNFRNVLLLGLFGGFVDKGRYGSVIVKYGSGVFSRWGIMDNYYNGVAVTTYDIDLTLVSTHFEMFYVEHYRRCGDNFCLSKDWFIERVKTYVPYRQPLENTNRILRENYRVARKVFELLTKTELKKPEIRVEYGGAIVKVRCDVDSEIGKIITSLIGGGSR